jgi:hypothetical protein
LNTGEVRTGHGTDQGPQRAAQLGHPSAYVLFSRSMANYASYFGYRAVCGRLAKVVSAKPTWPVVYRNPDVVIYRVTAG